MGACCILHMSLFHAVIVFKIVRLLAAGLRGVGVCCILHISYMRAHMSFFYSFFFVVHLLVAGLRGVGVLYFTYLKYVFVLFCNYCLFFLNEHVFYAYLKKKKVGTLVGTDALGNRYYENKSEQVGRDR